MHYGVRVRDLAAANGLGPPYTSYAGQTLRLPRGAADRMRTYVVRPGDTLSGIAARLGTTVQALVAASDIDEPDHVRAGQVLSVPPDGAAPLRPARTVARRASDGPALLRPVRGDVVAGFAEAGGGLEIAATEPRAPVRAAADGEVVFAGRGPNGVAGVVVLRHDDGGVGVYAHADEVLVSPGDRVRRGAVIARLADRDRPRLRFELREGGLRVDPSARLLEVEAEPLEVDAEPLEVEAELLEVDAGGREPEPPTPAPPS